MKRKLTIIDDRQENDGPHTPLNPTDFSINDINIKTEQQSGHFIIDMLEHCEINMDTPFQRSSDLWTQENMSRFIESMMLKFPIPPFYFDISYKKNIKGENIQSKPYWEVVDGLQRLSAIRNFIFGNDKGRKFKLKGLDFFSELDGKGYDSLPPNLKRNIESCQLSLFLIYPNTPKNVKHRIFERVNTGGLTLNAQEIRHALNQGIAVTALNNASIQGLEENGIYIDSGRMKDHELCLRFIAFEILGAAEYENSMKNFLDQAMERLNGLSKKSTEIITNLFADSVSFIIEALEENAFRKPNSRVINRALFDSYTWAARQLSTKQRRDVLRNKAELAKIYSDSFSADNKEYLGSISTATARKDNVTLRLNKAKEVLLGSIK